MKSELPEGYIDMQSDMLGCLFVLSAERGLDSDDFVYKLMTSKYGQSILDDTRLSEWADEHFMLSGLMRKIKFKQGGHYDRDVLWYAGYLYKYWISHKGDRPEYVYKLAPIKLIAERYNFYHTQGWEYVINDLKSRR